MKRLLPVWMIGLTLCLLNSCAVLPTEVNDRALPAIPFNVLIEDAQKYMGDTIVTGGYVVSVENFSDQTKIIAVQSPLGFGQKPKSKDYSQGRLVLIYKGFIDPEVYTNDRQITIGGKITGSSALAEKPPYPYLEVEISNIHLWAVQEPIYDHYWYDDYYPFHYPWWWHHRHYRHRHH